MKNRKKQTKGMWMILAGAMIAGGTIFGKQVVADYSIEILKELEVEMPDQKIQILIHTYGNETYMAEGALNVIQNKNSGSETVMEVQGSLEKIEDMDVDRSSIDDIKTTESAPTVLTVYTEDKIYGFYSRHELIRDTGRDGNPVIYYGYLEGYADNEIYSNSYSSEQEYPASYQIENFPVIYQMPELPTGCEITAMTMMLNYYGLPAEKVEMATAYLPTLLSAETYFGEDGRLYGNDMNQYFIGDPTTQSGIICGPAAIITAANSFLIDNESAYRAVELSGTEVEKLYDMVSRGIPVMVWCTIGMESRSDAQGWYTEDGTYVDWSRNDHGAVLIGYSSDTVVIADPISGIVEYEREQFESVFLSRKSQCVILERDES